MHKHSHIIFSFSFDGEGKAHKLDNQKIAEELKNDGLAWVHLDGNSKSTAKWLQKEVSYLDHLIIDALLADETRPRIVEFEDGFLLNLRGVNLNENSEPEDMVSIRLWVDAKRVITVERRSSKAIFDLKDQISSGKTIRSAGEFLYNLIYEILTLSSPFVYGLTEKIDALEEKIMTTHDVNFREQILQIRTQSTSFKRYLIPQREVISKLCRYESKWINSWARRHFQENLDSITNMIEEVEEAREHSQILHDELFHGLTEKLNRSMYKISLITMIFMPLTFVTGLFGMNVGGIPGNNYPHAFFLCSMVMTFSILLYLLFLRKKGGF